MQRHRSWIMLIAIVLIATGCQPQAIPSTSPRASATAGASGDPAPSGGSGDPGSTACEASTTPPAGDGTTAAEQVLRLPLGDEPESLDPTLVSSLRAVEIMRQVTHPLVYFDAELNTVPGLAESWEISDDGTEITFNLRDANYSNGDPIVAQDFVYSWRRLVDPRVAADYSYVMYPLAGAAALLDLDTDALPPDAEIDALLEEVGVSAPDEKTFVVQLAQPASYFLSIATLWVTVPLQEEWIESENATESGNYVASGPFTVETWDHNSRVVLVRNPEWFGEPAKLERIEFTLMEDEQAAMAAYLAGELDMVGVPAADIARICADPALQGEMIETATAGFEYYGFDLNDPESPLARSPALRRALAMSIDKQTLVDTVRQGAATVAGSAVPPGIPGHQPDAGLAFDPAAAQQELQTALTELGVSDVGEIDLTVGYNTSPLHEQTVDFMAEQWRTHLGIEIESEGLEAVAYSERRREDPFPINRASWTQDYPHAQNFLGDVFAGGSHFTGYSSEEFDNLIAEAGAETDAEAQTALYEEAQGVLVEDAPVIFLYWYGGYTLVKPHVQGLVLTTTDEDPGMMFFNQVSIGEH